MDTTKVYEFPIREHWRQPRALLGAGAAELAGPEAATMGLKHVLFVTSGLRGTGIVDEVRGSFEDSGVAVTVYDGVESNPKDYNVMDAYQAFAQAECDGFVSLGGGSSHDTAKGARIVAAHDGRNVNDFAGLNVSERLDNPPQIAINTTVGTGSETTPAYVITDTTSDNAPYKWVGFDKACTTTLAINDPVLMLTQPAEYVAYTGFDTMAHASECYTNRVQMHSATPQSLRAVELVEDNLRQAYANPRDIDAMTNMMWAQYMAAQAFSSGAAGDHPLALARRLRVVRRPPRPQQRRRHRARVDLQPPRRARTASPTSPTRCTRRSPACPGSRRSTPRSRRSSASRATADPGELVDGAGVPQDAHREGLVREPPREDRARRRRAREDGGAHARRHLHAGEPASGHAGDVQGDPARLRVRLAWTARPARRWTAGRTTAASAPRCRASG